MKPSLTRTFENKNSCVKLYIECKTTHLMLWRLHTVNHCQWLYTVLHWTQCVKLYCKMVSFSRSVWKKLHRAEKIYTGSARGARDNYEVWPWVTVAVWVGRPQRMGWARPQLVVLRPLHTAACILPARSLFATLNLVKATKIYMRACIHSLEPCIDFCPGLTGFCEKYVNFCTNLQKHIKNHVLAPIVGKDLEQKKFGDLF